MKEWFADIATQVAALRSPRSGAAPDMTVNPAGRLSWLAGSVHKRRLRWPLNRWQTRLVSGVGAVMLICIALMIWPMVGPNGPAGIIYWVHDSFVLPVRGRVFERYAPVPQLLLLLFVVLSLMGLAARDTVARVHALATDKALSHTWGMTVLRRWVQFRGGDSYLLVQVERRHRVAVSEWLTSDQTGSAGAARRVGEAALELMLLAGVEPKIGAADIGLGQTIARHGIVLAASGQTSFSPDIATATLGPVSQFARRAVLGPADGPDLGAAFEQNWKSISLAPPALRPSGTEAICWIAALIGRRGGDAHFLWTAQSRRARLAFEQDNWLAIQAAQPDMAEIHFDPALGLLADGRGSADGVSDVAALRQALAVRAPDRSAS